MMRPEMRKIEITFDQECIATTAKDPLTYGQYIASKAPTPEAAAEEIKAVEEANAVLRAKTQLQDSDGHEENDVGDDLDLDGDDESDDGDALKTYGETVFPRQDGKPIIWNHLVKGNLKAAASAMNRVPNSQTDKKARAFLKIIDQLVHVRPRVLNIQFPGGKEEIGSLTRPLRGKTKKGERITIVTSETMPIGSKLVFEIHAFPIKIREDRPKKDKKAKAGDKADAGLDVVEERPGKLGGGIWKMVEEWLDYGEWFGIGQWRNAGWGRFTWREVKE